MLEGRAGEELLTEVTRACLCPSAPPFKVHAFIHLPAFSQRPNWVSSHVGSQDREQTSQRMGKCEIFGLERKSTVTSQKQSTICGRGRWDSTW